MASHSDATESFSMKNDYFERNAVNQESFSNFESGFKTTREKNLKYSVIKLEHKEESNESNSVNGGYDQSVLNTEHHELHKSKQDVQALSVKTEPQDGSDTKMLDSKL